MFPIPYTLERLYYFIRSKMPQRRIRGSDIMYAIFCFAIVAVIIAFAYGIASGQLRVKVTQTSQQTHVQP